MATRQALIDRLRLELSDYRLSFDFTANGWEGEVRFDLPNENVTNVVVEVDGSEQTAGTDYVLDAARGIVVFTTAPEDGATVEVTGEFTELYDDATLGQWIDTAFSLHGVDRNPPLTMATLPPVEDYLVVLLAKVEALYVLATDAAYDIDIRTPEGISIPRSQRFAQMMALINSVRGYYKELAQELNVGPGRIVNLQLRRVSKLTGRLVPIYLPREVDDHRPPHRVYPTIDARGAKLPEPSVPVYDIQLKKGDAFSEEFNFSDDDGAALDLTGYTFDAHIHKGKHQPELVVDFTVTETDLANGVITLSLTEDDTKTLESTYSYVYHLYWTPAGQTDEQPILHGDVLVESLIPSEILNNG